MKMNPRVNRSTQKKGKGAEEQRKLFFTEECQLINVDGLTELESHLL